MMGKAPKKLRIVQISQLDDKNRTIYETGKGGMTGQWHPLRCVCVCV